MDVESPAEIVPLDASHDFTAFDCGEPALNSFVQRFAFSNERNSTARTYVLVRNGQVIGYYSLVAASIRRDEAPARIAKGLARHPIPVVLLARLAVDLSERGRGFGAAMLRDALLRIRQAAKIVGCRAVMVHAKDEKARAFYSRFNFKSAPDEPFRMFLLMKDVEAILVGAS